jgi:hypothetical protein
MLEAISPQGIRTAMEQVEIIIMAMVKKSTNSCGISLSVHLVYHLCQHTSTNVGRTLALHPKTSIAFTRNWWYLCSLVLATEELVLHDGANTL